MNTNTTVSASRHDVANAHTAVSSIRNDVAKTRTIVPNVHNALKIPQDKQSQDWMVSATPTLPATW